MLGEDADYNGGGSGRRSVRTDDASLVTGAGTVRTPEGAPAAAGLRGWQEENISATPTNNENTAASEGSRKGLVGVCSSCQHSRRFEFVFPRYRLQAPLHVVDTGYGQGSPG